MQEIHYKLTIPMQFLLKINYYIYFNDENNNILMLTYLEEKIKK